MGFNFLTPASTDPNQPSGLVDTACTPNTTGMPAQFNASSFLGISFRAKLGAGAGHSVLLKVTDAQIVPTAEGGACSATEVDPECHNAFGATLATLTDQWQTFSYSWADLAQDGTWGQRFDAIDPTRLIAMQFQVGANVSFNYWIDDVAFIAP
jgi:hypothetical protein